MEMVKQNALAEARADRDRHALENANLKIEIHRLHQRITHTEWESYCFRLHWRSAKRKAAAANQRVEELEATLGKGGT